MKKLFQSILNREVILYLIFGVAATIVYTLTRIGLFTFIHQVLLVTLIANGVAILFAFVTNDQIVFQQKRQGWSSRLIKFISARMVTLGLDLLLAFVFVQTFPGIIGQFVNHDLQLVNAIATLISQVLVIVLNYILSKLFVFTNK